MLNWICPGCGRECLPATRECPSCAKGLALADTQRTSVAALSAAVSGGQNAFPNSGSTGSMGVVTALLDAPAPELTLPDQAPPMAVAAEPPPPAEPEPRPALEHDLKQVQELLGERISRVQNQYAKSTLDANVPVHGHAEPAQETALEAVSKDLLVAQRQAAEAVMRTQAHEQWDSRMAEAAAGQLTAVIDIWEAAQRVHAEEEWKAKTDEEARRQRTRGLRVLEDAISGNTTEAVHEPAARQPVPAPQPRESAWDREVARQREASAAAVAEDASLAMRVYARETLDAQAEAASQLAYQQAIGALVETFRQSPVSFLLNPPIEVLFAPVRIAGHRGMARENFKTHAPPPAAKCSATCEFPSPSPLLAKLQSRLHTEQNLPVAEQKRVFPSWVLSAVAVATTILVAVSFFRTNNEPAEAGPAPDKPAISERKPSPASAAVSQSSTYSGNPFARDVEVSGLRIGVDLLHHSQLQYLVVNHSGVQLTGLMLHIKVSSTAPATKGTLFQVSAAVPTLGPNESKEIRTDIEGQLQSKPIPDWQFLKTEVQVSSQ